MSKGVIFTGKQEGVVFCSKCKHFYPSHRIDVLDWCLHLNQPLGSLVESCVYFERGIRRKNRVMKYDETYQSGDIKCPPPEPCNLQFIIGEPCAICGSKRCHGDCIFT